MEQDPHEDAKETAGEAVSAVLAEATSLLTALPILGPVLGAIASSWTQRKVRRLEAWLHEVDRRVGKLGAESVRARFQDEEFCELFEDGALLATRAVSKERLDYLAELVAKGLSDEHIKASDRRQLLSLLAELSDVEVLRLAGHTVRYRQDDEFWEKHEDALDITPAHMGSSPEELEESTLQSNQLTHLVRIGLLKSKFKKPKRGELPAFDKDTGMMQASGHSITHLGRLLLQQIGLLPPGAL